MAGKPHCGQIPIRHSSARVQTEQTPHPLSAEQTAKLARMRAAYEELTEAYEAMRRMVERGYLTFGA